MKNNKGFFAISLIYSFFLVFLILMVTILTDSVNNRQLVGKIKEDARDEINGQSSLVIEKIPDKNPSTGNDYEVGNEIQFAGEYWYLLKKNTNSYTLILKRSLTESEIITELNLPLIFSEEETEESISLMQKKHFFKDCYGTNNNKQCLRACIDFYLSGNFPYCYHYSENSNFYTIPTWSDEIDNSIFENENDKMFTTLVSTVTKNWFFHHHGLQKVLQNGKLIEMEFNDGNQDIKDYIRLPLSSEVQPDFLKTTQLPFHLVNRGSSPTKIQVLNLDGIKELDSYEAAYIRPVIEVCIKQTGCV